MMASDTREETETPRAPSPSAAAPFRITRLATRDADEQAARLSQWDQTYEQITPGRFEGELFEAWFDDIQLFRERTNQSVHEQGTAWKHSRTFGVPLAVLGSANYSGMAMGPDMLLTLDGDEELDFRTPRSLDIVGITIASDVFARYASQVEGRDIQSELARRHLIHICPRKMEELRRFLLDVFDTLCANGQLLGEATVRRSLQHAVLSRLLAAVSSGDQPVRDAGTGTSRRQVVDRARAYVLAHLDDPVSVAELCTVLNVSRRTLQYAFQEILDTNPVGYLRAIRLNGVRRELKAANGNSVAVQDVAARWGFWHLSHFATDYRRMFGELPSETLRGVRPCTLPC
jgi:AraC family ethanolamine operon transcriptional activator